MVEIEADEMVEIINETGRRALQLLPESSLEQHPFDARRTINDNIEQVRHRGFRVDEHAASSTAHKAVRKGLETPWNRSAALVISALDQIVRHQQTEIDRLSVKVDQLADTVRRQSGA